MVSPTAAVWEDEDHHSAQPGWAQPCQGSAGASRRYWEGQRGLWLSPGTPPSVPPTWSSPRDHHPDTQDASPLQAMLQGGGSVSRHKAVPPTLPTEMPPARSPPNTERSRRQPQLGNTTRPREPAVKTSCTSKAICQLGYGCQNRLWAKGRVGWRGPLRWGVVSSAPRCCLLHTAEEGERKRRVCSHWCVSSLIIAHPGAAGAGGRVR